MRAIAALALARLASASSVSSTLAAYQKFADEMVAKYGEDPSDTISEIQRNDLPDETENTVTDVSAVVGNADEAAASESDKDTQTIQQVITWLDALYMESLVVDHDSDVVLMETCQQSIDACEDGPSGMSSKGSGIGSACQDASGEWSDKGPDFDETTSATSELTSDIVNTAGTVLPDALGFQNNIVAFKTGSQSQWLEKSLWVKMYDHCQRHKKCRIKHQQEKCKDQSDSCKKYDDYRKSNAFPLCAQPDGPTNALRDTFIQQEWWFDESDTMEKCLSDVAKWFVGCTADTGAQYAEGAGSCVGQGGVWFLYEDCDQALKDCAEATLTCDDIQHEHEAAACDWAEEKDQACRSHYDCYNLAIEACAKNCRLIQHRVVGRKAEYEIIQRIICMLRALLANNDEHGDETSASDDSLTKKERLDQCKNMGDYDGGLSKGLDTLNITCQGPKKHSADLKSDEKDAEFAANFAGAGVFGQEVWKIDLNGKDATKTDGTLTWHEDTIEEHNTGIKSYWKPGWRATDYLPWEAEYPRGSQNEEVGECGVDTSTKQWCTDDTKQTVQIILEVESHAGSTLERVTQSITSSSLGHDYNSKSVSSGGTQYMVHRRKKQYQKWGYGCSSYSPCSHAFIRNSYGFLADKTTYAHAARAPCHKCDYDFKLPSGDLHDDDGEGDPCLWSNTEYTHEQNDKNRFDNSNKVGDKERNAADYTDRTHHGLCECFHSRDENFCPTDAASKEKTCSSYCHQSNRNTKWDKK